MVAEERTAAESTVQEEVAELRREVEQLRQLLRLEREAAGQKD